MLKHGKGREGPSRLIIMPSGNCRRNACMIGITEKVKQMACLKPLKEKFRPQITHVILSPKFDKVMHSQAI